MEKGNGFEEFFEEMRAQGHGPLIDATIRDVRAEIERREKRALKQPKHK